MASLISILEQAGFTGNGLRMALAIAMAESRGSSSAFNGDASTGDQSYGLFQINMLGAMGPERRKQYGLSSNDDLFDALTNAKVAYAMSNGGTNWSPWSTYKSGAYKQYLGNSGSIDVGTTSTSGGGVTTPAVTPQLDPATLAALYGLSSSLINSNKELKKLFGQAVQGQWTADVFVAHLKNTQWWQTQSDTMRQFITLKYTDPASFKQKMDQTAFHVNQLAVAVGYGNLLGKGTDLGKMDPTLQAAVLKVLQAGWTDQQVTAWLGGQVKFSGNEMAGQAGQDYDKLYTYAYANGLTQSPAWFLQNVRDIEGGKSTVDTVLAQMRQSAASKYSAYATQIQAGQNVLDLAAPYTKAVAQLLELPDGSVDLSNKYVEQAMTATLPKGGMPGSQMPLWQFEDQVRNDPLWRKTDNARESTATTVRQIGQIFGATF